MSILHYNCFIDLKHYLWGEASVPLLNVSECSGGLSQGLPLNTNFPKEVWSIRKMSLLHLEPPPDAVVIFVKCPSAGCPCCWCYLIEMAAEDVFKYSSDVAQLEALQTLGQILYLEKHLMVKNSTIFIKVCG